MPTTTVPPTVKVTGAIIGIRRTPGEREAYFNRDDVATTYLLLLDWPARTSDTIREVKDILMSEYGLDSRETVRCVMAACLLIDNNLEP